MNWKFLGFHNWPAASGDIDLVQMCEVKRASLTQLLERETCKECVCWREYSTCCQVQVVDLEETNRLIMNSPKCDSELIKSCTNHCPILFFDFIGVKLPVLELNERTEGT